EALRASGLRARKQLSAPPGFSGAPRLATLCALHRPPPPAMSSTPIRVAVTGAAGQIGYALVFRIASGQMFGPDRPVALNLIEVPAEKPMLALKGVVMELEDCAFPLLRDVVQTSDPKVGFKDA